MRPGYRPNLCVDDDDDDDDWRLATSNLWPFALFTLGLTLDLNQKNLTYVKMYAKITLYSLYWKMNINISLCGLPMTECWWHMNFEISHLHSINDSISDLMQRYLYIYVYVCLLDMYVCVYTNGYAFVCLYTTHTYTCIWGWLVKKQK